MNAQIGPVVAASPNAHFGHDVAAGGPCERFNLSRRVHEGVPARSGDLRSVRELFYMHSLLGCVALTCSHALHLLAGMRALFQELEDGSEACGEEIQRRHNSTIWTKVIPEHVGL